MADIRLQNVSKSFGKTEVLKNLNLHLPGNKFTVFVGPSGCGKSTLLRLIAGLADVSDGSIQIAGTDVTCLQPAKRGVAMVFQSYALYPHMRARQNIAFGLKRSYYDKQTIRNRVEKAAKILHLEGLLTRKPKELSGGQRQRVAIGRAIVREPKVFLFDEPLSNLDAALRVKMRIELSELKKKLNTTMIYVTHDQVEAMTLADQIVVLNKGQIEQIGSPLELYRAPANKFVASFIGSPQMNLIEAILVKADTKATAIKLKDGTELTLPFGIPVPKSKEMTLGLRPEHFEIGAKENNSLTGKVLLLEHLGPETYVDLQLSKGGFFRVRVSGDFSIEIGSTLHVTPALEKAHCFDKAGCSIRKSTPPLRMVG